MSRATEILDLGAEGWAWWHTLEKRGTGAHVVVESPDDWTKEMTKDLSAKDIHAAFEAAKPELCCEDAMSEDGYGFGCANDADIVLQFAMFGETIFG